MKTVTISIVNKEGYKVGIKEFNVNPRPKSKSLGYMVGYINALEDNGFKTKVIDI
tara:strand:- start:7473 stop:7637 length:165 start_codon:yes stop_codon:yes gene_type:complete